MKKMMFYLLCSSIIIFSACQKNEDLVSRDNYLSSTAGQNENYHPNQEVTFKVTIKNLGSSTTPFAPGVWLTENRVYAPLFRPRRPDFRQGLEALAEDGDPSALASSLSNKGRINSYGVFNTPVGASGPAPIFPGESYEFTVSAGPRDALHFATMFVQSNDLFISPAAGGISLFDRHRRPIDGDITRYLQLWDAGTEVNEEPGVGMYQAPRQSGPDMGPDENGVVKIVNDGFTYPAVRDILKVTVTPM